MACGDTNSGCGGSTEKKKVVSYDNLKYLLDKLSGKIVLAAGSIKVRSTEPLHLEKTYDDEGVVINGYVDTVTTNADGLMTCDDKVLLDKAVKDIASLVTQIDSLEELINNFDLFLPVTTLPTEDIKTNRIYLLPAGTTEEGNVYEEWINPTGTTDGWELLGSITLSEDLSNYVKFTDYVSSTKDGIASKENYDDWYNLYDKVFIVCRVGREEDFEINLVSPSAIKAGYYTNRTMYGIAVAQDNKMFIVALGESEEPIAWSSGYGLAGTALATAKEAIVDADGESNTDTIIAASTEGFITNTSDYAAGFCRNYGNDMFPAGSWYLPSMYELLVIKSHLREINYALNLIGATPIRYENVSGQAYWASSECSAETAWELNMFESHLITNNKVENKRYVRPVTVMRTEKIYTYGDIEVEMSYPTVPYSGGTVCPELTYKQAWTCSDGTSGEITDGADVTLSRVVKNSKWSSTTTGASYSVDASGNVTIGGHAGLEAGTYLLQITLNVKLNGKTATASAYVYQETEE